DPAPGGRQRPASIVERCPAPGIVALPGPAIVRVHPVTAGGVGLAVLADHVRVRSPGPSVVRALAGIHPLAVGRERLGEGGEVRRPRGAGKGHRRAAGAGGRTEQAPERAPPEHRQQWWAPQRPRPTPFLGHPAPARSRPSRSPGRRTLGTYSRPGGLVL